MKIAQALVNPKEAALVGDLTEPLDLDLLEQIEEEYRQTIKDRKAMQQSPYAQHIFLLHTIFEAGRMQGKREDRQRRRN